MFKFPNYGTIKNLFILSTVPFKFQVPQLEKLTHLGSVIRLQNMLLEKFSRQLPREIARITTIGAFLEQQNGVNF